jgi:hypothetical protein
MAHVAERPVSYEEHLTLPKRISNLFLLMIGGGLVLLVLGIVLNLNMGHEAGAHGEHGAAAGHEAGHHAVTWVTRLFANLWLNNVWFTGISVIGAFFVALQYVTYAYWSVPIRRVLESLTGYLPVGAVLMLVLFLTGKSYLFHWTAPGIMDAGSANYDAIIAGKSSYLNLPFFLIRMVVYLAIWILFARALRANSVADFSGAVCRLQLHGQLGLADVHRHALVLDDVFVVRVRVVAGVGGIGYDLDCHQPQTGGLSAHPQC